MIRNIKVDLPKKILFVDDNPHEHLFFKEALRKLNIECNLIFAWDGEEALKIITDMEILPDIMFLDLNMPKMNGFETLRELKMEGILNHLPIVLYTTSCLESEICLAKEYGAWWFLKKPPLHLLPQALQSILEQRNISTLNEEITLKKFR